MSKWDKYNMKKENVSKLGKIFVNSENKIKQFEIIGVTQGQ